MARLDRGQRNLALLVAGCFFMEQMDVTIVTTAAPRIAHSLHVASTTTSLLVTAYLVTLAVLIPLSGWLTARWGTRPVFLAAIVIFTLASAGCAASTSVAELVVMRVTQGVGGAMMVPVGRLTVLSRAAKSDLIRVISYVTWPGLVAPVIAPLVGGALTTYASWHWIFLINLPLGLVALAVAWRLVRGIDTPTPPPLDRLGVVLTGVGLAGLTYTGHLASETPTPWGEAGAFAAVSVLATAAAVWHLLRAPAPLLNLRTLRIRTYRVSVQGSAMVWLAHGSAPFLLPLLFEEVFGWSAVKAGAVVLFAFIGNVGIKPTTTPLLHRFSFRRILTVTTTLTVATTLACAFLTAATPLPLIALIVMLGGATRSVCLTCYVTMAYSDVSSALMRDANTFYITNQQISAGFGVALAAVALRIGVPIAHALPGIATGQAVYGFAFAAIAACALMAVVGAVRLPPTAGDSVRRPERVKEPAAAST